MAKRVAYIEESAPFLSDDDDVDDCDEAYWAERAAATSFTSSDDEESEDVDLLWLIIGIQKGIL